MSSTRIDAPSHAQDEIEDLRAKLVAAERNLETLREQKEALELHMNERNEELAATNKELEGFCYSVSHDLRGPLRSLMGAVMILNEDYGEQLDAEAGALIERLRLSAKKINDLIDDILRFSRLGRQPMVETEVDLSAIAEAVTEEASRAAVANNVSFEIEPGLRVTGDESLLRMTLENLIENAVKFGRSRPELKIRFGSVESDGTRAFFVRDNGIGFDPQYADQIFKPFERLHTEREYPGTGIGLANVQRIVARHRGRVWTESEPGKGATFFFTIGAASAL